MEASETTSYSYLGFGASVLTAAVPRCPLIHTQKGTPGASVTDGSQSIGIDPLGGVPSCGFNLSDRDFHKPHWWVELEAEGESSMPPYFSICREGNSILRTKLGYKFAEHMRSAQLVCGAVQIWPRPNLMF